MKNKFAKHEREIIDKYQKKGYTGNYRVDYNSLVDLDTKINYPPQNVYIVAEYRFEGMSNPSDMSILYILETKDGSKGTVLANYSPARNLETAEFFKQIPKENYLKDNTKAQ
ncbi:hypothetical protein DHD05_06200 [Arenibacter sp. N53]|uniref:hypothetical protein n=1 Tax=Arenibacter TaxID=178469 RepID=UPI000CD45D08|nr:MULTISPECIES: hypothetical protein [Arenibacter]MCM4151177.1 hypothetical protein [Arenibacter sp. N53]